MRLSLMVVGGLMLGAAPVQAGLGSILARVGKQLVRFVVPDTILRREPSPVQGAAVNPPSVPGNVRAVERSGTALELAWEASTPGEGRTIVRYKVWKNGVLNTESEVPRVTVTINPTGTGLESFTVTAVDSQGVASPASAAVVALRGAPVPFEIQRRTAFVQVEAGGGSAEAALAEATSHLADLQWGGVFGAGAEDPFLISPLAAFLAVRLYEGDGTGHEMQVLSQGEYRIRIGAGAPGEPGPGPGPLFPSGPTGDPDAELPVGARVPVRWAEVFQSFEEMEPQVLAVRTAELLITPEGAVSPAYFVPVPDRAGFVAVRLLPNLAESFAPPISPADPGPTAPGVLAPGEAADLALLDPVGTDYTVPHDWPVVVTVQGPAGVVRILAIDPAVESSQGWDAALADGIEIPPGAEFAAYVSPEGKSATGRRLVVVGLSPGEVRLGVGMADVPATWAERVITVLPRIALAVDADRDGIVVTGPGNAADQIPAGERYRFWVNDDDDKGETGGRDIPLGAVPAANFQNEVIDGARDLVDFFPVFVDAAEALRVLADGPPVTVRLRHADGAVNFAYTNLDREHATAHWRELRQEGFGDAFNRPPGAAETHRVTAEGVALSVAFLNGVRTRGSGVLLIEGRSPTLAPLVLEVERSGQLLAEARLPMRLSNVEEMFRQVDLTTVPKEYDGSAPTLPEFGIPDRTGDPGEAWPDRPTNDKYFVFVHGYNVDAQGARGWQSEIFKRLHVLGSRSRFVGVTWHGATGLRVEDGYLDYHKAVFNALQTGQQLKEKLPIPEGAQVTVAGHSLGNGVVAQAIQFGGFRPEHYIMINPAIPVEALSPGDVPPSEATDMVEWQWGGYDPRLQAGHWFELFPESDARSKLTWQGRFRDVSSFTGLHHFYSSGEDVLANLPGTRDASLFDWLGRDQPSFAVGSWKMQELVKGVNWSRSLGSLVLDRGQAGWSFAPEWQVSSSGARSTGVAPRNRTPDEAKERQVPTSALITQPFFGRFMQRELMADDAAVASEKASDSNVEFDLLARAIPAKSYAAAANPMITLGVQRNYDMNVDGRVEGVTALPTKSGRWGHSDLKELSLPLTFPTYSKLLLEGGLR